MDSAVSNERKERSAVKYKHVNYNYEVYILDVNVIYISQDDIRFYMDRKDLRDGYGGGKVGRHNKDPLFSRSNSPYYRIFPLQVNFRLCGGLQ